MSLDFVLPWPPTALSPNTRQHWSKLAKAKKRYFVACQMHTFDQAAKQWRPPGRGLPERFALDVEFVPPTRRRLDVDNSLARMKAGLDGMCFALCFDDSRIAAITVSVADEPVKGGAVRVRLRDHNEPRTAGAPVSAQRGNQEAREGPCPQASTSARSESESST